MPIAQRFNAGVKYLPVRQVPSGPAEPFKIAEDDT